MLLNHNYFKDRALKRMDGEDVYGHKIRVLPPLRTIYGGGMRSSSDEGYTTGAGRSVSAPPAPPPLAVHPPATLHPPMPMFPPLPQQTGVEPSTMYEETPWSNSSVMSQSYSEEMIGGGPFRRNVMDRTPLGFRSIKGTHGNRNYINSNNSNQLGTNGYPQASPSLSPSITPSPSPSPTLMDLTSWNASERSMSEHSSEARSGSPPGSPPFVDITVTNLEHSADPQAVRSLLHKIFSEHVPVIDVSVRGTSESLTARVRVNGTGAAQLAVSRLHRRRVGGRRLLLSLQPPPPSTPLPLLKRQVANLLQSAPEKQLPLFRLRELYAARHGRTLPAGEISRLKDTCILVDSPRGRSVKLLRMPPETETHTEWWGECEKCVMHGGPSSGDEEENGPSGGIGIQPVYTETPMFTHRVHSMLALHGGVLILNSFPLCYEAQFGEPLCIDPTKGVPLEHLLSSTRGVAIRSSPAPQSRKLIVLAPTPTTPPNTAANTTLQNDEEVPGSLASMRALLARELLDLLRTANRCQMPFSRLIPSYHLHFGRQCRVADYGFTRLADLLDALSHTVQVMGEGSGRMITLSHTAQMKRFTADLLKVLRAQPDKSLLLAQLPELYQHTLGREFDPVEYGACRVEDLVNGVARSCVALGPEEGRIGLPKHKQTPEEMARIKHFALQAAELLKHAPNCRLELSRFVPAYHTHFGRQLRVAHYGLPKVQDLFHAIPETVKMWTNEESERVVALHPEAARSVLTSQLASLNLPVTIAALPQVYRTVHGHTLQPSAYGFSDLLSLVKNLPGIEVLEGGEEGGLVTLGEQPQEGLMMLPKSTGPSLPPSTVLPQGWGSAALIAYKVLATDKCISNGGPPLHLFCQEFKDLAGYDPPLQILKQNNCIKISNWHVVLPLLWRCVGRLVSEQRERILTCRQLEQLYNHSYQHPLPLLRIGFQNIEAMISHCNEIWEVLADGKVHVRQGLSSLLPPVSKPRVELLPNTPPGQKSSGVWSTPPAVACGPWRASPTPPAPSQLPLPAPQLLSNTAKRRIRLAAQFDCPS